MMLFAVLALISQDMNQWVVGTTYLSGLLFLTAPKPQIGLAKAALGYTISDQFVEFAHSPLEILQRNVKSVPTFSPTNRNSMHWRFTLPI